MVRELTLFCHFIGFGLVMTLNVAGFILHRQYKKAPDLQQKSVILRAARPIGLLSPFVILLMLVTGIGNMHALGLGLLDAGWLSAKIIFFTLMAISGTLLGLKARKRGNLVASMLGGTAPAGAEQELAGIDKQISLSYVVLPLLTMIVLALSIYGRLGGQ